MSPPWACAICFAMKRPRPRPCVRFDDAPRRNGSNSVAPDLARDHAFVVNLDDRRRDRNWRSARSPASPTCRARSRWRRGSRTAGAAALDRPSRRTSSDLRARHRADGRRAALRSVRSSTERRSICSRVRARPSPEPSRACVRSSRSLIIVCMRSPALRIRWSAFCWRSSATCFAKQLHAVHQRGEWVAQIVAEDADEHLVELQRVGELTALAGEVENTLTLLVRICGSSRLVEEVDRAALVAAKHALLIARARGDEDDRHVLRALGAAHELGELEAVHLGHLHVEQREAERRGRAQLERFGTRARAETCTSVGAAALRARSDSPACRRRSGP